MIVTAASTAMDLVLSRDDGHQELYHAILVMCPPNRNLAQVFKSFMLLQQCCVCLPCYLSKFREAKREPGNISCYEQRRINMDQTWQREQGLISVLQI